MSSTDSIASHGMISDQAVSDDDRDSLYSLALSWMPIENPSMRHARIVKNSKLDTVIELYRDGQTGSGQVEIESLPKRFQFSSPKAAEDLKLLRRLALLPSYDVYSLRVMLRDMELAVDANEYLRLSSRKVEELSGYMRNFTRPLLLQIYGSEAKNISSFADVVNLFKDPDIKEARRKLEMMAAKLGLNLASIPNFLEDYADIFMSLSYYKSALDDILPTIESFIAELQMLKKSYQLRSNAVFMEASKEIEETFSSTVAMVTGSLESFNLHTKDMWRNLSAARFRQIENLVRGYHTTFGGILCGLTVKMEAWRITFPNRNVGGPNRRGEFIMSDLRHGLAKIREIQATAPSIQSLN